MSKGCLGALELIGSSSPLGSVVGNRGQWRGCLVTEKKKFTFTSAYLLVWVLNSHDLAPLDDLNN